LGQQPYLDVKAEGNGSMAVKQGTPEDVYGAVLQDPRAMVRATLPEPVRRITRPVYLPYRGKELGGCSWVIELTRHRKVMGTTACSKSGEHPKTWKVDRDRKTRVLR
jgi:hypothetical protein